jgi:hypothetical protein
MKKSLFLVMISAMMVTSYSQSPFRNSVGIGIASLGMDSHSASKAGVYISYEWRRFYFDISNNLAGSRELRFDASSHVYIIDKLNVGVVNAGYRVIRGPLAVTPLIGWAWSGYIYRNPLKFDSWAFEEIQNSFNLGIVIGVAVTDRIGLNLGAGMNENFKAGITWFF